MSRAPSISHRAEQRRISGYLWDAGLNLGTADFGRFDSQWQVDAASIC